MKPVVTKITCFGTFGDSVSSDSHGNGSWQVVFDMIGPMLVQHGKHACNKPPQPSVPLDVFNCRDLFSQFQSHKNQHFLFVPAYRSNLARNGPNESNIFAVTILRKDPAIRLKYNWTTEFAWLKYFG